MRHIKYKNTLPLLSMGWLDIPLLKRKFCWKEDREYLFLKNNFSIYREVGNVLIIHFGEKNAFSYNIFSIGFCLKEPFIILEIIVKIYNPIMLIKMLSFLHLLSLWLSKYSRDYLVNYRSSELSIFSFREATDI